MTPMILAVQVALPLVLIAWVAFLPAGSLSGFVLQAAGKVEATCRFVEGRGRLAAIGSLEHALELAEGKGGTLVTEG